jgi:LysR family transcriptional regulator, low CO2-responsive transcriptional regulator
MTPPLDSRQLRAFVTLARTGSFMQSARELHLTQSAVSHSMRALENEVGCRLLDRLGKSVSLTQAGEQLLAHAARILNEMEMARERLTELGKWGHGRLRIATSLTACQYILPAVLREFKESFPQCVIYIETGDTARMLQLLDENRVDVAFSLEPRTPCNFVFQEVFEDELLFHTSPLHPWARTGKVERSEIPRQRFIFYTKTSYLVQMVDQYFRRQDIVLPTSMELGNIEAIKELVKLGVGISILAPWVAQREIADGSVKAFNLGKTKLKRRWGILTRKSAPLNLQQATFIGLCRAVCENLMFQPAPAT